MTHFVTSLDAGLLEAYRNDLRQRYVELGDTQHYYGSPTTPVLLHLAEWVDDLSVNHRGLFDLIVLRSTCSPRGAASQPEVAAVPAL